MNSFSESFNVDLEINIPPNRFSNPDTVKIVASRIETEDDIDLSKSISNEWEIALNMVSRFLISLENHDDVYVR